MKQGNLHRYLPDSNLLLQSARLFPFMFPGVIASLRIRSHVLETRMKLLDYGVLHQRCVASIWSEICIRLFLDARVISACLFADCNWNVDPRVVILIGYRQDRSAIGVFICDICSYPMLCRRRCCPLRMFGSSEP